MRAPECLKALPKSPVLGCGTPRDDFGDEDAWVLSDVRVIRAACNAEAQPGITLSTQGEACQEQDDGGTTTHVQN